MLSKCAACARLSHAATYDMRLAAYSRWQRVRATGAADNMPWLHLQPLTLLSTATPLTRHQFRSRRAHAVIRIITGATEAASFHSKLKFQTFLFLIKDLRYFLQYFAKFHLRLQQAERGPQSKTAIRQDSEQVGDRKAPRH